MGHANRDVRIELYRIFLMFGISLLHAASFGFRAFHPVALSLAFCVDGFVFITGWFGTKCSLRKIVSLEFTGLYCAVLSCLLLCTSDGGVEAFRSFWFLHSYVLMLCFVGVVNFIMKYEQDDKKLAMMFAPFLVAVFGWGICTELPILHRYIPRPYGLGSFGALTLTGIYVGARLFRRFHFPERISTRMICILLPVFLLGSVAGYGWFGHYCSPLAFVIAALVFGIFDKLPKINNRTVSAITSFVGSSLFTVYLLQVSPWGRFLIRMTRDACIRMGVCEYLTILLTAITIFLCGLILDFPRRIVEYGLTKIVLMCRGGGHRA